MPMTVESVASAVRCALDWVRVGEIDAVSAERVLMDIAAARSVLDAAELAVVARLREMGAGDVDVAAVLVEHAGRGARDTGRVCERAKLVAELPEWAAALGDAAIAVGHVDALSLGMRKLGAEQRAALGEMAGVLASDATQMTVDTFADHVSSVVKSLQMDDGQERGEKQRRSSELKAWIDNDGMVRLRGRFDSERGSVVMGRLQGQVEALFHSGVVPAVEPGIEPNDNLRAQALYDLVSAGVEATRAGGGAAPLRAEIVVMIDFETLRSGWHAHSTCRTSSGAELTVASVRRMACDAAIVPMVMSGEGEVLDVGRAKRLATSAQRKAIFAMYTSCAVPECRVNIEHCVPHHIDWWEHGGRTDLANLVPMCSRHHHAVHEGGWKLEMRAGRKLQITRPVVGRRC